MAITTGTVMPITPYNLNSGAGSSPVLSFPITSAKPITAGDVIIMTSGKVLDGNTAQSASTIVGIAAEPKASVATAGDNDQLLVFPAYGGTLFIGNFVGGAGTDYSTNAYTDIAPATLYDTVELTVGAFAAVNFADTTGGQCKVVQYAREQMGGLPFKGVGTTPLTINPRVIFKFASTIFQVA